MNWIKMRSGLHENPRVIAAADSLKLPVLHMVGMLWRVWSWADAQSLDGNAVTVTDVTLDRLTDCPGLAGCLRNIGWLEGRPEGPLTFPRFAEHNGQTAKARVLGAERASRFRNAPNVTKALPDKRREEKIREEGKEQSAARAAVPVKRAPKLSDDEWQAEMQRTYPSLNVREEFGKARVWLTTNAPRRTLTRAYLLNWLNRAADRKAQFNPNGSRPKANEPTKFRDLPEADQKAWKEAVLAQARASVSGINESDPNAIKELFDDAAGECRCFHKGDWRAHTMAIRAKLATVDTAK